MTRVFSVLHVGPDARLKLPLCLRYQSMVNRDSIASRSVSELRGAMFIEYKASMILLSDPALSWVTGIGEGYIHMGPIKWD